MILHSKSSPVYILVAFAALTFLLLVPKETLAKKRVSYLLNKPQCTQKNLKKIESLSAKIISIGQYGRPFPETYQQVKPFCRDTTQMVTEVENFFKDCYQKAVRDIANLLIFSIKNNLRKYCNRRRSKVVTDMLKVSACANKHVRIQIPCMDQFINQTKQLINLPSDKDPMKVNYACCNFVNSMRCADTFLENVSCIRNQRGTVLDFVRGLSSSITDVMCGDYNESSDTCDALGPPPAPKQKNKTKYITFAFVLIDLLESMKDFTAPL